MYERTEPEKKMGSKPEKAGLLNPIFFKELETKDYKIRIKGAD